MKAITLKAGREKSALRYHPWIFSGAVDEVVGAPELGDTVEVYSYRSDFLGLAAYSPKSQIRGRFWTFGEKTNIDREFFDDETIQKSGVCRALIGTTFLRHSLDSLL